MRLYACQLKFSKYKKRQVESTAREKISETRLDMDGQLGLGAWANIDLDACYYTVFLFFLSFSLFAIRLFLRSRESASHGLESSATLLDARGETELAILP